MLSALVRFTSCLSEHADDHAPRVMIIHMCLNAPPDNHTDEIQWIDITQLPTIHQLKNRSEISLYHK